MSERVTKFHLEIVAIATLIQALATVGAGLWILWAFYYSEEWKPRGLPTFLNPLLSIEVVGSERSGGQEYYVLRVNMDIENKSGRSLSVAYSNIVIYAQKLSSIPNGYNALTIQNTLNTDEGPNSRYRGVIDRSQVVYSGREFHSWDFGVGERIVQGRIFRVPVGEFDQVEAKWTTFSGSDVKGVDITNHVTLSEDDKKSEELFVETCVCEKPCSSEAKFEVPKGRSEVCLAPWYEIISERATELLGGEGKSGTFSAKAYLILPAKN